MKFISVNKLFDFEFHDAEFTLESLDNDHLKVKASYLNIHKDAEQNPFEIDMEIDRVLITFEEFNLMSYESRRAYEQDERGELSCAKQQIVLTDDSAYSRFSEQLEAGLRIYDFGVKEGDVYFIDAMSIDPFFTVCFTFKNVRIEFDEYKKEAWYTSR